jgi:inhibitor of KinA sporulation pathway (predicted exonuclease)
MWGLEHASISITTPKGTYLTIEKWPRARFNKKWDKENIEELKIGMGLNTGEVIDPFITNLTGIKQEDVDNGISLFTAYEQLKELHIKHERRNRGCVLTWGIGDMRCLREALHLDEESFYFGRRFIDVKTVFISYQWANDLKHQAGLAKALTKLGLCFDGKKHDGMADAKNTFIIFRKLLEYFKKEQ